MDPLLLGIDVGTTAAKAVLFSPSGQPIAFAQAEYPTHHVRPGWVEQHPEDWWQAVCQAVQQVLSTVPEGSKRVGGVSVSAQAPTLIALDRDGVPIRPAMIWMDRRAEGEAVALNEQLGADVVYRISGNRTDAFYLGSKLLWFKNHEPALRARTRLFVQINGYINYRLTDTFSLDNAHAGLLQLRDYAKNEWSAVLCEACGVVPTDFPEIRAGHVIQGEVTRAAAEATGLRPGTPVMVGTVDAAAAAIEAGAVNLGAAAEMTGTSTVLLIPSDGSVTESALIAMPHALPDLHMLLGAMVASGACLRWFRDQFGKMEVQTSKALGVDPFDLLTVQASQIHVGSDGVIFLPYMMGERAPLWNTNARGVFFGLSLTTSRAALIRAILEGTAFALRHNVDVARRAGISISEIRSVGGGARSELWNQIKADVLGYPILLPRTSVGAPFGDAILVGIGLGLYPDVRRSLQEMIQVKSRFEPNAENYARYTEFYNVFRSIYEHTCEDFDKLASITQVSIVS